jgi:hypothetical protein
MTEVESQTALKNIVDDWLKTNTEGILKGLDARTPMDLLRYERSLLLIVIALGKLLIEWILKTKIEDGGFQKRTKRNFLRGHPSYRHQSNKTTPVRTLFGNIVRLKCNFCATKRTNRKRRLGKNGTGSYPALEALGIRHHTTPALASEISMCVTEGPSMEIVRERLARYGLMFDVKVIKRISEHFAQAGLAVRNAWVSSGGEAPCPLVPENETYAGCRVHIGNDGGRLRIRKTKVGRIRDGKKRHGFDADWREPKMLAIRVLDEMGTVVRSEHPVYDGTIGDADAIFSILRAHLKARHIELVAEVVCNCDGAPWIWDRMGKLLDDLGVERSKVTLVLDYFHAVEHITAVADGKRSWSRKKRTRWMNHMKGLLINGRIAELLHELGKLARGRSAPKVRREMRYFEENSERMHYDLLAEKKLPKGSGATESAIRQVVNTRLKGAGMFWLEKNAEALLHLRCYLKAGRWNAMEEAVFSGAW